MDIHILVEWEILLLPDGYNVNKGDMVAYQPYAMGMMKYIWGDDTREFKPECWNGCAH